MTNVARSPLYKRRRDIWKEVIFDKSSSESDSVAARRLALLDLWRHDPWAYLTGRDVPTEETRVRYPYGKPIIWTVDELDDENPVKPFPEQNLYLKEITGELLGNYRFVFIDKVRQMYISTLCCLLLDWYCAFNEEREVIVSKVKEEAAAKLINDKIRTVYNRKPGWLQAAMPITHQPKNIITYKDTQSTITAVAQNFGLSDARGITASLVLVDEAAYQAYFPQIYQAVMPMASKMWAVTTANIGNEGAKMFREMVFEGRPLGY